MAELSNDPVGQLNPDITYDINHRGSVHLAELAKQAGVERFVYTSSCSVYGIADQDIVDELSAPNPQTAYAVCKTLVERDVGAMADDSFSPTFLRNATAYGASPRMRFDIVLNNLSGLAWTTGRDPDDERRHALAAVRPHPRHRDSRSPARSRRRASVVHGEIFNVGSSGANYQVREIAEIVGAEFPGCRSRSRPAAGPTRAATASRSTRSTTACPGSPATGTRSAARASCTRSSSGSR